MLGLWMMSLYLKDQEEILHFLYLLIAFFVWAENALRKKRRRNCRHWRNRNRMRNQREMTFFVWVHLANSLSLESLELHVVS